MNRLFLTSIAVAAALSATAQDTYESGRLLGSDLNGTARYVGMGGALDALGADISTIATNPAGVGLFRHHAISASMGLVIQQDARKFDGLSKTCVSFDQIGFVYSSRMSKRSYLNFAFNYHKSRNFDQLLQASNALSHGSLNKLTYAKATKGNVNSGGFDLGRNSQGDWMGYENSESDLRAQTYSQLDYLQTNALLEDPNDHNFYYTEADAYTFDRAHRGWIANYDFNISGNANDRVYWGVTVGLSNVNYKGYSEYTEGLRLVDGTDAGTVTLADERRISGTGFGLKGGVIIRPVEQLPLRFGLSVATPTWYDLKSENQTQLFNNSSQGSYDEGHNAERYDFKYYTPWTFGLSAGHTFGNYLAVGLCYEFADYGASQNRINDGYNYYGDKSSYTDTPMKRNTEDVLKGVSTIRVGMELKPIDALALRLGYNYVTPMMNKNGERDMTLNSPGVMYASTADYTNWQETNRVTAGVGYKSGGFTVDLAYQFNQTEGTFYPFQSSVTFNGDDFTERNIGTGAITKFRRHQLLLTLGYTF